MQRIAVVATLKPGMAERAKELITKGPPFDLEALKIERHTVYLSDELAVFVFEGGRVSAMAHALSAGEGAAAFAAWDSILSGIPRLAEQEFVWERSKDPAWAGTFGE